MPARSNARLLAPLALAVFALVLVIVVASSGVGGDSSSSQRAKPARDAVRTSGRSTSTTPKATSESKTTARATPKSYTVKQGDILSTIAETSGVTVERLQELNPDVDPQALVAGQSLKLRK